MFRLRLTLLLLSAFHADSWLPAADERCHTATMTRSDRLHRVPHNLMSMAHTPSISFGSSEWRFMLVSMGDDSCCYL